MMTGKKIRIGIIGGGASGMFASIAAADVLQRQNKVKNSDVFVFESTSTTMKKVKISGGGRCNVMHDTSKSTSDILGGYPRGSKELNGIFHKRFQPSDAKEWFVKRGVTLKTEPDGRMFPITDSSQTIIDTITDAADNVNVHVCKNQKVTNINIIAVDDNDDDKSKFVVSTEIKDRHTKEITAKKEQFDSIILATGSSPVGYKFASNLGHTIVKPVPSLFTLNTKNQIKDGGIFHGLSGVSVKFARLTFKYSVEGKKKKQSLIQEGPLLITHHGISGPATLRLSAFGARQFHDVNYRGDVLVHWCPELGNTDDVFNKLWKMTSASPKKQVSSICPLQLSDGSIPIPKRLWSALVRCSFADTNERAADDTGKITRTWSNCNKKSIRKLASNICEFVIDVTGKGVFKEEFVTAGGVKLKEIDMKTMESKKTSGLYFCGEVIDVDGVTGGFNFMNCWSTGYVAGTSSAAEFVTNTDDTTLQRKQKQLALKV